MKNIAIGVLIAFGFMIGMSLSHPTSVSAQSGGNAIVVLGVSPSLSGCAWPSGATVTNGAAICPTLINGVAGLAVAVNGGAFTAIGGGAAPVSSVFGRTGNVTPATGDYSWSQISGQPTGQTCTTATLGPGGLTTSGCTYK
jgi:hypothetical protein